MMNLKVIKNEADYHLVLQEAEALVAIDPLPGSNEADRLELLTLLIEDFERREHSFEIPDPIEAIEFRMSEQGLRQKDLVPLIGSRSRVSEVLSRKRPLTVPMIRALSTGLGIPLEALISEGKTKAPDYLLDNFTIDWSKFPLKEMEKRGWLESIKTKADTLEEKVKEFLIQVSSGNTASAFYRRNFKGEEVDSKSYYSTLAWSARVQIRAKELYKKDDSKLAVYDSSKITDELMRDIARLSWFSEGPKMAIELLRKYGVIVVIEPKLPNALIDGAAMLTDDGVPVIGLTLRYDRVDYFWFTLLHEMAHIWQHLNSKEDAFIDRLENMSSNEEVENDANRIARESFIPRAVWRRSMVFLSPTKENIQELANELHIHSAIVAGRLHYETGRYETFRELLGQGSIRKCFPEINFR